MVTKIDIINVILNYIVTIINKQVNETDCIENIGCIYNKYLNF